MLSGGPAEAQCGRNPRGPARQYAGWDSLNTINLLAVVEEEFGVTVGPDEIPQLTSFAGILALLRERVTPS